MRLAPVAAVLLIAACGSSINTPGGESTGVETPVVTGPLDPYADPPDYEGDPFVGFPEVTGLPVPDYTGVTAETEILSGAHYTIQIAAATSEEAAVRLAGMAEESLTLPVFIDPVGGFWKVRVGAFPSRTDADSALGGVRAQGYPDAWVTTRDP